MASHSNPLEPDFFTTDQVAVLLGVHPVTVRRWRSLNTKHGAIKYGPPYEYRGARVVYPKAQFRQWCGQVTKVDGVPRINLPITATVPLPETPDQRETVIDESEVVDG